MSRRDKIVCLGNLDVGADRGRSEESRIVIKGYGLMNENRRKRLPIGIKGM